MKNYELNIVRFEEEDVISTSNPNPPRPPEPND